MHTSNHSWNAGDRPALYVTSSGIQLLAYLDYVQIRSFGSPALFSADTRIPPEQYDLDRPAETELERLYREMDEALEAMRQAARKDDDAFIAATDRYNSLRDRIYHLENDIPFQDDDDDDIVIDDDDDPAAADDNEWANNGDDIDDLYDDEED